MDEHDDATWSPITGGVSSDLWSVRCARRTICVKAALMKLKVSGTWNAPVSRNNVEVDWLRFASEHAPGSVPRVLAADPEAGMFAMEFFDPASHHVWKRDLIDGAVDNATAAAVGDLLGRLHHVSTEGRVRSGVAHQFATDENFHALRIEPYLIRTASAWPEVAPRLSGLATRTASIHRALVHGDVSPKNILIGPDGPILLDAECAWWGDPAFDLAFCLNHLILKALVADPSERPTRAQALTFAARDLWDAYLPHVVWENAQDVAGRVADLIPALMLARVDGASPVEYITTTEDRELVRNFAVELLSHPDSAKSPLDIMASWEQLQNQRRESLPT